MVTGTQAIPAPPGAHANRSWNEEWSEALNPGSGTWHVVVLHDVSGATLSTRSVTIDLKSFNIYQEYNAVLHSR